MTNREVIDNFLARRTQAILSRINHASGRTARRIYRVVDQISGTLYGPDYIAALEDGRGPTKTNTPSNPTLQEAIEEWLQFAGIPTPQGFKDQRSFSFAIAASIHAKGTRLFQQGGRSGVLSETITERSFDELINQLADIHSVTVFTDVVNKFKLELKKNVN